MTNSAKDGLLIPISEKGKMMKRMIWAAVAGAAA